MKYICIIMIYGIKKFSNAFDVDPLRHLLGLSYIEMRNTHQHLSNALDPVYHDTPILFPKPAQEYHHFSPTLWINICRLIIVPIINLLPLRTARWRPFALGYARSGRLRLSSTHHPSHHSTRHQFPNKIIQTSSLSHENRSVVPFSSYDSIEDTIMQFSQRGSLGLLLK